MDKQAFKQRMQNLKSYRGNNPGKGYIQFMEELAEAKSKEWKEDEDMTLLQMLNDNTYNYKQMYEDNPDYNIQEGHFKDTYKTVYHPTFSNESMYSGQKSQYNPEGIIGGWWDYDNKIFHANPKQDLNYTQWYLDREDPGWKVQAYQDGGEVDEFQRKTRRDIMQESLVDGRPNYNKMFQNQNKYQKDFANYWYTERAKNPKYSDQIGGDKLNTILSNVNRATWKTPTEAMRDNMVGQGYNPTDAQINQQLNILKEKGTKGFANPKAHSYTSLRPTNTWHEGVGHMVGDNTPAILNATPNVRISNPDSSYEDYVNQANEKHAQTWDFRGNNSNLKDDQGNYYIDPNRQLTPEDISNMRSKGAKIPEQWESLEDADISELTNTFAYNLSQDPIYFMANGGEVGDPDDEFTKAINTKLGRTPDGKFIYKRNPDNDYIPNTAEHELSHFTDLLKSGRPDAHAGNNVFYQMTKDLTKRVGDKHDDYFLLPTEQKAHMNQLREWMFQNGYINRRDQKVTPEYMSKIMKQLNNVEGMKGVQRAAQQFKSNKTFTKWFNSVPLIGAGLLGVNKYFTDEDKQEK